jgi:aspartate aminotransferase
MQSHATSNPNTIAQYASIEALNGDQHSVLEMRNAFMERRDYMVEVINSIPLLSCLKPDGAFYVLVNVAQLVGKKFGNVMIKNSIDFANFILETAGIAVVPGEGFGLQNYIRLSYTTSMEDIKEGLTRIKAILGAV